MIKRILSNRALIRFLRRCFGPAIVTLKTLGQVEEEEKIKDSMLVILTKEDTGEKRRVD